LQKRLRKEENASEQLCRKGCGRKKMIVSGCVDKAAEGKMLVSGFAEKAKVLEGRKC
jgi:hypothetical protein